MLPRPARDLLAQTLPYQLALAINLSATLLTVLALGMLLAAPNGDNVFYVALMSLLSLLLWVGLLAARRNHAAQATLLVGLPVLASTLTGVLINNGAALSSFSYALPLVLGAMLLRSRQVLGLFALCALLSAGLFMLELAGHRGPIDVGARWHVGPVPATLLILALVTLSSLRGQQTLRAAQATAERRARELEETQRELHWRQWELEVVQDTLLNSNETLQHQLVTLSALGVGAVFIRPGALLVPLQGEIGIDLAHAARARILAGCTLQEARILVLDLCHATCRARAARLLVQTLEGVAALGVDVIVCGAPGALAPLPAGARYVARLREAILMLD
jgi:hypothetical protein